MTHAAFAPYATVPELHVAVCNAICQLVTQSVSQQGVCRIALSGGSTPKRIYELLSERDLPWQSIHWFWGDERNVPHDHDDSNYRMVKNALFNRIQPPDANVFPVPVDTDNPTAAAQQYEETLKQQFGSELDESGFPRWDLALLGMGDDAHTASLFPETSALDVCERWFVENWVEKFSAYRYTLTIPAINSAREKWFLVSGAGKKEALAKVLSDDRQPKLFPSQFIRPTRWFVTTDAMS